MRIRLNGWQRTGIVVSVIWAIGGPIYIDNRADRIAFEQFDFTYNTCRNAQEERQTGDPEKCMEQARRSYDEARGPFAQAGLGNWILQIFVPIAFGWLIAYALIGLLRWIRRGFSHQ